MTNDLLMQTMTLTKDRPVLSSESVPHNNKTLSNSKKYLVMSLRWELDTKTDWLIVSHNVTLTWQKDQNTGEIQKTRGARSRQQWGIRYPEALNVWTVIIECKCDGDVKQIQSSNLESTIISHVTSDTCDNIKMDLREIGWDGMGLDWAGLG
jgi:hypothetical protein